MQHEYTTQIETIHTLDIASLYPGTTFQFLGNWDGMTIGRTHFDGLREKYFPGIVLSLDYQKKIAIVTFFSKFSAEKTAKGEIEFLTFNTRVVPVKISKVIFQRP